MVIVGKAQEAASMPPLSDPEWESKAKTWAEALWGVVPEEDLTAVWLRAIRNHRSTFPVSQAELLTAWDAIERERAEARHTNSTQLKAADASLCVKCFGTGMEQVRNAEGRVVGVRRGCTHEIVDTPAVEMRVDVAELSRQVERQRVSVNVLSPVTIIQQAAAQVQFELNAWGSLVGEDAEQKAAVLKQAVDRLRSAERYLRKQEMAGR
jgi:hypothetical protein